MHIFTTFPFLFFLVASCSFALPAEEPPRDPINKGMCYEYNNNVDPPTDTWSKDSDLSRNKDGLGAVWGNRDVKAKTGSDEMEEGGHYTVYKYTIHYSFGKKKGSDLYIYGQRTRGKGLGQLFKVNFHGLDGTYLTSYLIYANNYCNIRTKWPASDISKVTTNWKDTSLGGSASAHGKKHGG